MENKVNLLGISGKIGSGKDTVGKIVQYLTSNYYKTGKTFEEFLEINTKRNDYPLYLDWQIKKFADKLKDITCLLIGCNRKQLEDQEFKNKELGEEWDRTIYKIIDSDDTVLTETFFKDDAELDLAYYEDYHHRKVKLTQFNNCKLTPRLLLQLLGTECGREIIHPNIWVNSLFAEYVHKAEFEADVTSEGNPYRKQVSEESKWIITDMRFPNELEAIKQRNGVIIRVNRPYTTVINGNGIPATFNHNQFHPSETSLDNAKFDYVIDNSGNIEELIEKVKTILVELKVI